ncbi:MAG: hypothetical protein U9Q62_02480 [Campylobacterota bacterium]|nr:hypothetical protein [Campylobacterota bacterium]
MRLFALILLLPSLLLASKILSYNVYDRTDRADIMLTFDTPYNGNIRQSRQSGKIIIKLDSATIESPKLKKVSSPFLSKLAITPVGSHTQIIATVPGSVILQASKTSDAYGLRLRFAKAAASAKTDTLAPAAQTTAKLPTKPEDEYTQSYYIVIAILIIGIIILLLLKRKISASTSEGTSKPWLFSSAKKEKPDGVTIRFQKALDQKNRVVMMDYADESYLVVIGSSNLLLDKFNGQKPVTENEFDSMLKDKNQELDSFLQIDKQKQEPFDSYKEKASGINFEA